MGRARSEADKLSSAFDDPIAGLLDPEVTTWAQQVRAVRPVLAATLLSAAGANLEAIIRLAQNNPPTGWRPTGTNRDDSDFDLLLILPDTVPESLTGQATGRCGRRRRRAATQKIAAATRSEPDVVNSPLVNEVKRFGVGCHSDWSPPTRSDRECRNARSSAPGVVAGFLSWRPGVNVDGVFPLAEHPEGQ